MAPHVRCQCGIRQSTTVADQGQAAEVISIRLGRAFDRCHEVSILMATVGRYRGARPRSKVSMMIIRPPQQGQGGESVCGSLSWALSAGLASFCVAGTLSSCRARAM